MGWIIICVVILVILVFLLNPKMSPLRESLQIFLWTKLSRNQYYKHPNQIEKWSNYGPVEKMCTKPVITWLGHSTFLIQTNKLNIITDPIFYDLSVLYPRNSPCGITPDNLPPIDIVIISHTHRDHCDKSSLCFLQKRDNPRFLVPFGAQKLCAGWGFTRINEFTWWQKHKISNIVCTFLPAKHWSNRGLFDTNQILWGSWMIQSPTLSLYFAGDSAYDTHFTNIANHFQKIDVAILPIAPNEPRHLMKNSHMSAYEAGQAFLDLNAHILIPMHWGTFRLGTDTFSYPVDLLRRWWNQHCNKKLCRLLILKIGQCANVIDYQ
jgi:L-ascorbate metabolism protein UlaG (beta-lactamase superfamily)